MTYLYPTQLGKIFFLLLKRISLVSILLFTAITVEGADNTFTSGNRSTVMAYANKVIATDTDSPFAIGVVLNTNVYAGTCHPLENPGQTISYVGHAVPGDKFFEKSFAATMNHELVGHGIERLADEYWDHDNSFNSNEAEAAHNQYLQAGFGANVDFYSDPEKVKWSHMLIDV